MAICSHSLLTIYRLIENRYKCKDCLEQIGFDLVKIASTVPLIFLEDLISSISRIMNLRFSHDHAAGIFENRTDVSIALDSSLDQRDPEADVLAHGHQHDPEADVVANGPTNDTVVDQEDIGLTS
ncbi:zinc finger, ZZ-type, Zinc finger, RING/FYVE/PHD-type [Artemisia annua]|uniref:Zinc finger, ZZ-type, Zinc finger, RING/FYVE/PHD-type n=1 Tax=Artemisia annua TaxID=35608 RepID=A0A2U1KUN3_ARTAN|nr:zinc finger, ZZ-type, Zinc finger, RING/FYVE/PHD-type [Artemisia annua]